MSLFLLYTTNSSFSLFNCNGIFRIGEKEDISKYVNARPLFRQIVDLVGFYQFEPSAAPAQIKALSRGRATEELQSFLLLNLPDIEAGKNPGFSLGVADTKLGSRISRATNVPCICDPIVLQLLGGVSLHYDALTRFPEPCDLDDAPSSVQIMEKGKSGPLLKYKIRGCVVEDLKKGREKNRAAALMDMVSVHYTVKRRKDDEMLLDTSSGDPIKFRLGEGKVVKALDFGICGMFVRGKRRFTVPPSMGYETKSGKGSKGVHGPVGASGHWLVIDVKLVAIDN